MPHTTPSRYAERTSDDIRDLHALLDSTVLCTVAFDGQDGPVALPTAFARDRDDILIHGSTGSRWMRALASGARTSVAVTALDAVVVARSAFESSFHYRSAVLFGTFAPVDDRDKAQALERLTNRLIPGRTAEVRPSARKELAATQILRMTVDAWSLKASAEWPDDPAEDVAEDSWAGLVVYGPRAATIVAAPDLRPGIPVPRSVQMLALDGRALGDDSTTGAGTADDEA